MVNNSKDHDIAKSLVAHVPPLVRSLVGLEPPLSMLSRGLGERSCGSHMTRVILHVHWTAVCVTYRMIPCVGKEGGREGEGERERERGRGRESEGGREGRERETERGREGEGKRGEGRGREGKRRKRGREGEREGGREGERERGREGVRGERERGKEGEGVFNITAIFRKVAKIDMKYVNMMLECLKLFG